MNIGKEQIVENEEVINVAINGCMYRQIDDPEDIHFDHGMLEKDEKNKVWIDFYDTAPPYWIRIEGIHVTSEATFIQLMDAVKELAQKQGYGRLSYADKLTPDLLKMFKAYGFTGKADDYDTYYLKFEL